MNFFDKLQDSLKDGLDTTHEIYLKAKNKAVELGEMGMTQWEIKQLEGRAEKMMTKLGSEVYRLFSEEDRKTISHGTEGVKEILAELDEINDILSQKNKNKD